MHETDSSFQYLHKTRLDPAHAPSAVDEGQKLKVGRWYALHERTMGKFRGPQSKGFERTSGQAVHPNIRKEVVHTLAIGPVRLSMPSMTHITWNARVFSFDLEPWKWKPPPNRKEAELRRSTWLGRTIPYDEYHWKRLRESREVLSSKYRP